MSKAKLFEQLQIGPVKVKNRIVMSSMTRNRAANDHEAPTELHVKYYSQRASAGLILTEGHLLHRRPGNISPLRVSIIMNRKRNGIK